MEAAGHNVPRLVWEVIDSSFGTEFGLEDLGLLVSPLVLTGLAAAVTLKMGLWNIGAEGQFYAGAVCATGIGLFYHGPSTLMLPAMAAAGIVGGAAWICIPAFARAFLQVNEIITTLLMNFIAFLLVNALCTGPWRDKAQAITSATGAIPCNRDRRQGWRRNAAFCGVTSAGSVPSAMIRFQSLRKSGHLPVAACGRKDQVACSSKIAQEPASSLCERTHAAARFGIAKDRRPTGEVDCIPSQAKNFAASPTSQREKSSSGNRSGPYVAGLSLTQRPP